jgi:hypothetical protein
MALLTPKFTIGEYTDVFRRVQGSTRREQMSEVIEIDEYRPNYNRKCEVCDQTPTVNAVKNNRVVYRGSMCGVCTWGESKMFDPQEWNK